MRQPGTDDYAGYGEILEEKDREIERLRAALDELLEVSERLRGGDPKLDPERWYAARDYARHVLNGGR